MFGWWGLQEVGVDVALVDLVNENVRHPLFGV
jgi:hypothetical protein